MPENLQGLFIFKNIIISPVIPRVFASSNKRDCGHLESLMKKQVSEFSSPATTTK
jgi:hypothetical protein